MAKPEKRPIKWDGRKFKPVSVKSVLDTIRRLGPLEVYLRQEYVPTGGVYWRTYEQTDKFNSGAQATETIEKLLNNKKDCYINQKPKKGRMRIWYNPHWSSRNFLDITEI